MFGRKKKKQEEPKSYLRCPYCGHAPIIVTGNTIHVILSTGMSATLGAFKARCVRLPKLRSTRGYALSPAITTRKMLSDNSARRGNHESG